MTYIAMKIDQMNPFVGCVANKQRCYTMGNETLNGGSATYNSLNDTLIDSECIILIKGGRHLEEGCLQDADEPLEEKASHFWIAYCAERRRRYEKRGGLNGECQRAPTRSIAHGTTNTANNVQFSAECQKCNGLL
ncbi:hypothetical protein CAPTEDRAFT_197501 [Capitella teleta]|uniref:Uncharacterized protein n=1 Tax=Capitella teleta TaxID=283909 RepID=R7TSE5_CAPTE|nr:hypothetical protein CAPTEDRAFT_197501 [Capitella teleta]|eukprot:ELT94406.1 hypothetical protein CAPTEDRAFT_197501 [Capitella teleta]